MGTRCKAVKGRFRARVAANEADRWAHLPDPSVCDEGLPCSTGAEMIFQSVASPTCV